MKKTSIISINLKFLRIPIALSLFAATVITSSSLIKEVPEISLNRDFVNFFLDSQLLHSNAEAKYTSVFSLLHTQKTTLSEITILKFADLNEKAFLI